MRVPKLGGLGGGRSGKGGGEGECPAEAGTTPVAAQEPKGNSATEDVVDAAGAEKEEGEGDGEDDDDFITNEVKRRLKELRKSNFMVLIPEEEMAGEEEQGEEDESSSREWTEPDAIQGFRQWCGFDALYDKYCERMLFFDRIAAQLLKDSGSLDFSSRMSSKKWVSSVLQSFSAKRRDDGLLQKGLKELQQEQAEDPCHGFEVAYAAQVSLSWEVLHCQYTQLSQKIAADPQNADPYNQAAQEFQQFQVLLQRFNENELFEQGSRVETYLRYRSSLSKFLQVPNFQGADRRKFMQSNNEAMLVAADLVKVIAEAILTFHVFLKKDQKKAASSLLSSRSRSHSHGSLQHVKASLDKKDMKVKELMKKKGWDGKSWPNNADEVELLFALTDIKVVARVLRISRLSKEQLLWCEEKMSKLDLSDNKLRRDGSPILFPC